MDVRPVVKHGCGNLRHADLGVLGKMNPALRFIAGHSVQSCSDLVKWRDDIKYITILRHPVDRYISQFNYWNRRLRKNVTFREFLADEETWNFQTKKIAGCADADIAKSELMNHFFHVGIVEKFDEFLLTLDKKLDPVRLDLRYSSQNSGRADQSAAMDIRSRYYEDIIERNNLDIELYNYVGAEICPRNRESYGSGLAQDIAMFTESNSAVQVRSARLVLDYIVRKAYYEPVTGVIRRLNGLPYRGSYETK